MSDWFADLPRGWKSTRLDRLGRSWPSNVDKHSIEGQPAVRLCNYTDVYKNAAITADLDFMPATATKGQIERFRLRRGDTLITKDSETADDIGIPAFVETESDDLVCGYHLAMVRPSPNRIHPKYLFWALASDPTMRQWSLLATGVTRVGIKSGDLARVLLAVPESVEEQRAIADYLDRETAQIDTLIQEQQRLIDLLRERRSAHRSDLLNRHIGRGSRLRWCFKELDERAGSRARDLPLMSVSISWGVRPRHEVTQDLPRAEELSLYKVCRAGDIVINRMRAFQGALGLAGEPGIVSPDYAVIRPNPGIEAEWLVEIMKTSFFISEMARRVKGIGSIDLGAARTPRINVSDLGEILVSPPNASEQREQSVAIAEQQFTIDALIAETERFIELSKERRSALITAAVTGQIDVSEAA